jgi:hypothetical protein
MFRISFMIGCLFYAAFGDEQVDSLAIGNVISQKNIAIDTNIKEKSTNIELRDRYSKFAKLKAGGNILLALGIPTTVVGVIILANSDIKTTTKDGRIDISSDNILEILPLVAGIELSAVGIVFSAIGGKKKKEYARKLKNSSVSVIILPDKLCINYCFGMK